MARAGKDEAVRITNASEGREADIRARQRRYLASMSLRTICFVGAVVAALNGVDWLWPWLVAAAIILPYVAVVAANVAANMSEGFKLREIPEYRRELGSAGDDRERLH